MHKLYTPQEVAEALKLKVNTVYEYVRMGKLVATKFGNRYRTAQEDAERYSKETGRCKTRARRDEQRRILSAQRVLPWGRKTQSGVRGVKGGRTRDFGQDVVRDSERLVLYL